MSNQEKISRPFFNLTAYEAIGIAFFGWVALALVLLLEKKAEDSQRWVYIERFVIKTEQNLDYLNRHHPKPPPKPMVLKLPKELLKPDQRIFRKND